MNARKQALGGHARDQARASRCSAPALVELQRKFFGPKAITWYDVLNAGWNWCRDEFLPLVAASGRFARASPRLSAQALYVLGDLYHYGYNAYGAAKRTYQQAVQRCPQHADAWQELGELHERTGRPRAALRAYRRYLALDPGDARTRARIQTLMSAPHGASPALFDEEAPVNEQLARNRPRAALRLALRSRMYNRRLVLARVYGMLGDVENCWKCIRAAAASNATLDFSFVDWFMLPDAIWDDPEFWRLLLKLKRRLDPYSCMPLQDDIDDAVPEPKPRPPPHSARWSAWVRRRQEAQIRLHIARLTGDLRALERLRRRYPKWKAVARAIPG